ncbi:MAG: stage sporulation protein [Massilibacillus sp.]|jgi:stage IV sporulation protein B|nr:stage sporulation protein [Massilibacillus sp.]
MFKIKWQTFIGFTLATLIVVFTTSPQFRTIYALPKYMTIFEDEIAFWEVQYPLTIDVHESIEDTLHVKSITTENFFSKPVFLEPLKHGQAIVDFKLFGFIPVKQVEVDVVAPIKVIAGGQSIGVILKSEGVLVVGSSPVVSIDGSVTNPAKKAGIQVGDRILQINDITVHRDVEVAEILDRCGNDQKVASILLKRNEENVYVQIKPILCPDTKRYRIGLFVRDSAVGVGTLTFFDPKSFVYGALGHVITDSDTNQPIPCGDGKIVPANVSGIQSGKNGQPGEKIGNFIEEDQLIGNIEKNTQFGIYGKINAEKIDSVFSEPIEVASMNQIQPGYAEMLTVIDGQTIERFAIQIEKVNMQNYPEGKGIVVKVIDERLLARTGGIVQGMSGSPIIQNEKIVGAITHVFVHDPTKGYGCFMDWMLMESGIISKKNLNENQRLFSGLTQIVI